MNVLQFYEKTLADRGYRADEAQQRAISRLQVFADELQAYQEERAKPFRRFFRKPEPPRGVYMWGGVGRGKSFLMDSFYMTVAIEKKTRIHFHEFMRSVHRELQELKGKSDPLDEVARRISDKYMLICFDEFHVSDIADAMILYKLLLNLFENGTSFVMTSNYEPSTLYPDGLHRDRILPAIALIEKRMDVLNVDTGVDYRHRTLEQVKMYLTPLNEDTDRQMRDAFDRLADTAPQDTELHIENRVIHAIAVAGSVVWFSFQELCAGPRSQNDYLELASRYQTIMLSGVPRMMPRNSSEARRFTWLIDVLYDHHVKLIMSAECPPEELYTEGVLANEFHRTVSRITEMQSKEYLESQRRTSVKL